jgi:hypothetical protein
MTHADGYFAIGKSHKVCQDYVRFGTLPNGRAYTIVSDGCSSSKDTDIGARLLVLTTEAFIVENLVGYDGLNFGAIITQARIHSDRLGLDRTCLDATLMIAVETENDILVYKMGDGVIATRWRGGSLSYWYNEFTSGAPYYPNYLCDQPRHESYMANADQPIVYTTGFADRSTKMPLPLEHYINNICVPIVMSKDVIDLVVLMTDGALSFRNDLESVAVSNIVRQIVDVKVPTGEFMVRRAKRFLGNYCKDKGWHHDDDFGVGAIFVEGK